MAAAAVVEIQSRDPHPGMLEAELLAIRRRQGNDPLLHHRRTVESEQTVDRRSRRDETRLFIVL